MIGLMTEVIRVNVIFGTDDVEPVLLVAALKCVGIEGDPRDRRSK